MRTTIEIATELHKRLLSLAARRGMKGFSLIIQEAIEEYLEREDDESELLQNAIEARGSLSEEDARHLETISTVLRRKWR